MANGYGEGPEWEPVICVARGLARLPPSYGGIGIDLQTPPVVCINWPDSAKLDIEVHRQIKLAAKPLLPPGYEDWKVEVT